MFDARAPRLPRLAERSSSAGESLVAERREPAWRGKVTVQSVIVNPSTDPHSYEPMASDGVAFARSQMAIVNGIGYDAWASKLIAANPSSSRAVLNVGDLLGLKEGITRTSGTHRPRCSG